MNDADASTPDTLQLAQFKRAYDQGIAGGHPLAAVKNFNRARGDLTNPGERVPALRVRSLGPSLAPYQGVGRA
jgi:hypothetical protein